MCSWAISTGVRPSDIAFCAALLSVSAGCSSMTPDSSGRAPDAMAIDMTGEVAAYPLFKLLRVTRLSEPTLSAAELVGRSRLVLRGTLERAEDGRKIDFKAGASHALQTAVFRVRVEEVLKGDTTGFAYVEFLRGGITIQSINELLPSPVPMMLFLRPADGWNPDVYKFEGEGQGLPAGAPLDTFTRQTGMVVQWNAGIEHPLAEDPSATVFDETRVRSLQDLTKEVQRLLQQPDATYFPTVELIAPR
jgi:hypothetical protein